MNWPAVIAQYDREYAAEHAEFLGNAGGFSGSRFWRLRAPAGTLCLRCWPREHPTPARLREIHAVLARAWRAGCTFIAPAIATRHGETFVAHERDLWELTRWLPGRADFHASPSDARLCAAMQALAKFHLATAEPSLHGDRLRGNSQGPSPGIGQRLARLDQLMAGELAALRRAADRHRHVWPELAAMAEPILELFERVAPSLRPKLAAAVHLIVPLQPCICDIWHDHVLFLGDEVSGLVDFGALRTDHVATDIARLLGSLVGDDASRWRSGVDVYVATRPLAARERELVSAFDASGVAMSSLSWIEWVFRDGREFDDRDAILSRVQENHRRLRHLAATGAVDSAWR